MTGFHPTDPRAMKQRQPSLLKLGGLLSKCIPRFSRRPLGTVDIIPSRSRHTATPSISSLAAAVNLIHTGFVPTQGMHSLSEVVGLTSSGAFVTQGISASPPSHPQQRTLELPNLSALPLDEILDRSMGHYDPSDLSPTLSVSLLPRISFDTEEPGCTAAGESRDVVAMSDLGIDHLRLDLGQAVPVLPRADANVMNVHFDEASVNIHPTTTPSQLRSRIPLTRPGSIPSPITHFNQRISVGLFNQSVSSLLTTATYVTAPTSPPASIQSFPRCESPTPLSMPHRRPRLQSFQTSSLRHSIIPDDFSEDPWTSDKPLNQHPLPERPWPLSSHTMSVPDSSSRKILIIGSSYKDHGEVKRMFSIETLDGALEDKIRLGKCFKQRSYSVQTLFEEGFDRKGALARVAQFLDDAESGDVRAIVFTGHGYTDKTGMVSLVPPKCSKKSEAITRADWDQNIREHSRAGVIVFSIMAHCYSGEIMKQELNGQTWDAPAPLDGSKDEPIFLTFAASDETAYESWVTRDSSLHHARSCDHFIHALTSAIESIDVDTGTWDQFFQAFQWYFQRARSCASWQDKQSAPSTPDWRSSNLQTPRFSASGFIRLSVVF